MAKYASATATGFVAYHEARGRTVPGTWDTADIDAALLVASEWIDGVYGPSFIGEKTAGFLQEREWPRINAVVEDVRYPHIFSSAEIPDRITNAVYEAAFRQASVPGSLLIDYTPGKYKRVSVDGAVSVEYAMFTSASDVQTSFPAIDQLLWPLLCGAMEYSSFSGLTVRA